MSKPVDILMITWNRRSYVEKTLSHLMSGSSDFRLYWWDNGSHDGVDEVVMSCKDERIVKRYRSSKNVMQAIPTRWFLNTCTSDIIGKVDDDTLPEHGWIESLSQAIRDEQNFGMIGCWTYWPDDFERNYDDALKKIVNVGRYKVLSNAWIGGTAFLMRKQLAESYILDKHGGTAFPIDRLQMTKDGFVSGWYFPLIYAEHMDDPRSAHCLMNLPGGMAKQIALTARLRKIKTPQDYQQWIMADADSILHASVSQQIRRIEWQKSVWYKIWKRLHRIYDVIS